MRVVGLISGGKDSIWNLHYCRHFGHDVVCVANLAPPAGVYELDSYMYQTVGFDLLDDIAIALGLPLVRRIIAGEPKQIDSNTYVPADDGDEVEDLTLLLQDVLEAHPSTNAVSCGAILSNYQRLRVESVCSRLGLKVLSFLWRQDQRRLLQQMVDGGLDARIVKVASMGLGARHIGESILNRSFSCHLHDLNRKWGVHVCGEGGEYESAVVDAPMYRSVVRILSSETVNDPKDDVAFLQATKVDTKTKDNEDCGPPFKVLEAYSSLDYYHETFSHLSAANNAEPLPDLPQNTMVVDRRCAPCLSANPVDARVSSLYQSPMMRPALLSVAPRLLASSLLDVDVLGLQRGGDAAEQCRSLLVAVSTWLNGLGWSLHMAVLAEVQLGDLGCFESVNIVYGGFFGSEPPARVCIQTPLPAGVHLRLRLLLRSSHDGFESLRVQSISTWAMACIGPYSQATRVGDLLFTSGVLGLVPHTMMLPPIAAVGEEATDKSELQLVPPAGSRPRRWETELWLLMRSLRNVLEVMSSNFGEAHLVHVYMVGERDFGAVRERVLGYMRREHSRSEPIVTLAEVPRLPKDATIEISLVCARSKSSSAQTTQAIRCLPSQSVPIHGTVTTVTKTMGGVCVCSSEFAGAEGGEEEADAGVPLEISGEALRSMAERCTSALCTGLGLPKADPRAAGLSLQVHFAVRDAHDHLATAMSMAVEAAGISKACVLSYMPADFLGPGTYLRLVGTAGA